MDPSTNGNYRTTDLRLAAYLVTRGLRLIGVDDATPERAAFVLSPRPDPADVTAYGEGKAIAEVGALSDALRLLKARLFERRRQ